MAECSAASRQIGNDLTITLAKKLEVATGSPKQ